MSDGALFAFVRIGILAMLKPFMMALCSVSPRWAAVSKTSQRTSKSMLHIITVVLAMSNICAGYAADITVRLSWEAAGKTRLAKAERQSSVVSKIEPRQRALMS